VKHSVLFDAGHPQKGEAASPHYRFDQPLRRFAALIAAIAIAAILVSMSAFAVSEKEAATVVRLLEALQEELGDFAYDASVADDWFEQDADSQGLIAEAGFTRASWKKALDETYAGFLANMPETDILGPLADARRRVEAKASLTSAQREELLRTIDAQQAELLKLREEGKSFAEAVRPLVPRMRALTQRSMREELAHSSMRAPCRSTSRAWLIGAGPSC
jgi:hypothetical protein